MWAIQGGLAFALCWFVFRGVDTQRVTEALLGTNFSLLIGANILLVLERLVRPYRLAILLGVPNRLSDVIAAQNVSQLVNLVLPMRSGEMFLVVLIRGLEIMSGSRALSIVFIDRLLDILFVLLIFSYAVIAVPALPAAVDHAAVILATISLMAFFSMLGLIYAKSKFIFVLERALVYLLGSAGERWSRRIEAIIGGFAVLREPWPLITALLATAATWGLATLATWLVLRSLWVDAPLGAAALAICMAVIGVSLVSVPAGVGVIHAAFALAAGLFGASQEVGLAFAVVAHFIATLTTALLGLAGLPVARRAGKLALWQRR